MARVSSKQGLVLNVCLLIICLFIVYYLFICLLLYYLFIYC